MRFLDEFRDPDTARRLAEAIRCTVTRPWNLMEVCGGQTHSIIRNGVDQILPDGVELIHGPGCPVCVTPMEALDTAMAVASRPEVIFCTFGDMVRVPGSDTDLISAKAAGADVRMVYSPMDALEIARKNPDREVVFFAVGFETTAPANAMAVLRASEEGVSNFSVLVSQVLVPPAIRAILESEGNRVNGFLAAGHVCTIMGYREYEPVAEHYQVPIVVTGFEPVDLLEGIYLLLRELESGRSGVLNQYARSVRRDGNRHAMKVVNRVFRVEDRTWRGLGEIPGSGFGLKPEFSGFDARKRFGTGTRPGLTDKEKLCRSGEVLTGRLKPDACPRFGTDSTPERPLGATMVSTEGACAAYYRYRRHEAR